MRFSPAGKKHDKKTSIFANVFFLFGYN